jgi:hypothetical protein
VHATEGFIAKQEDRGLRFKPHVILFAGCANHETGGIVPQLLRHLRQKSWNELLPVCRDQNIIQPDFPIMHIGIESNIQDHIKLKETLLQFAEFILYIRLLGFVFIARSKNNTFAI